MKRVGETVSDTKRENENGYWQRSKRAAQEEGKMELENKMLVKRGGGNAKEKKWRMKRRMRRSR